MNGKDELDTAKSMPRLASARACDDLALEVTWAEGARKGRSERVDLKPLIATHKFYRPLRRDPALFATARLVRNGRAVAWGEGEIDMSALGIEQLAEESMTAEEFAAFLARHRLTHESAAAALGYGKRQIENYLSRTTAIPRVVVLACFGYEARRQAASELGGSRAPGSHREAAE
jgi:hypothetical protein